MHIKYCFHIIHLKEVRYTFEKIFLQEFFYLRMIYTIYFSLKGTSKNKSLHRLYASIWTNINLVLN